MLNLDDLTCLKGHRFPRTVIGYALWAYHRFALSLRDVEDLLSERGGVVSHETIRVWIAKFGTQIATKIRRDRPGPADRWHLDEAVLKINGIKHWLWRAIDANGDVLDILVQSRRDTAAARRFMRKLFKRWGLPRVMVTDKLGSYRVAKAKFTPAWSIAGTRGSTTRQRLPTGILADVRSSWDGPNRQDRPSGSCRSTIRPLQPSAPAAIVFPPIPTAMPDRTPSTYGRATQPN